MGSPPPREPTPPPQYTATAQAPPPLPPRAASHIPHIPVPYNPAAYGAPVPVPVPYGDASHATTSQQLDPPPARTPSPAASHFPRPSLSPVATPSLPSKARPELVAGGSWMSSDPRESSTQSLLPPPSITQSRRKLLLIYIHGFLGNDQSFRSFPAHVHSMLSAMLSETHVIHSKIYPRYKTYRAVEVARDNFSAWLEPHESPTTDVVLIGHSMGGILAADVCLMPNRSPYGPSSLKHRILGHISLDCPFLGLHPGIIVSGLASLFKGSPEAAAAAAAAAEEQAAIPAYADTFSGSPSPAESSVHLSASQPSLAPSNASSASTSTDPFFNPPFPNDVSFKEQPFLKRVMHFANKYKNDGIIQSAARHVVSYLEFGSCLADPRGLEARYTQLRAMEDVDQLQPPAPGTSPHLPRSQVRFVNYYTICDGPPKKPKEKSPEPPGSRDDGSTELEGAALSLQPNPHESSHPHDKPVSNPPSIVIEDNQSTAASQGSKAKEHHKAPPVPDADAASITSDMDNLTMQHLDPTPMDDSSSDEFFDTEPSQSHPSEPQTSTPQLSKLETPDSRGLPPEASTAQTSSSNLDLPPIPDVPSPPTLPDISQYTDKDARKQAERESKRLQKAHDQAVKDRARAVRERDKLLDKRRRRAQKDADRAQRDADKASRAERKEMGRLQRDAAEQHQHQHQHQHRQEKEAGKREREDDARRTRIRHAQGAVMQALEAEAPRKRRQFCNLPRKVDGVRDRTWVEIFMPDVDEITAHTTLFFPGPQYETLVGDVGSRILGWVEEDMTKRMILQMSEDVD